MNGLTDILQHLQDPDAASSLIPLLIVLTFIVLGSLFAIYKVIGILRPPETSARKKPPRQPLRLPEFHWRWPKINLDGLWTRPSRPTSPQPPRGEQPARRAADLADLEILRELVTRLEQMNAAERELHGRALRKMEELQGELKTLSELREQEKRVLELERQARQRLEQKCRELEDKLRDAIRETERIFAQGTALAESQSGGGLQRLLKDFPPAPDANHPESSEEEKELLKKVLDSSKRKLG